MIIRLQCIVMYIRIFALERNGIGVQCLCKLSVLHESRQLALIFLEKEALLILANYIQGI